jgi:hypothetical protein
VQHNYDCENATNKKSGVSFFRRVESGGGKNRIADKAVITYRPIQLIKPT